MGRARCCVGRAVLLFSTRPAKALQGPVLGLITLQISTGCLGPLSVPPSPPGPSELHICSPEVPVGQKTVFEFEG